MLTQFQNFRAFVCGVCMALILNLLVPGTVSADCVPPHIIPDGLTSDEAAIGGQLLAEADAIASVLFGIPCGCGGGVYRLESPVTGAGSFVVGTEEVTGTEFSLIIYGYAPTIAEELVLASLVARLDVGTQAIYFAGLVASYLDDSGGWHHSLIPLVRLGSRVMERTVDATYPLRTTYAGLSDGVVSVDAAVTDPVVPPRDSMRDPATPEPEYYSPNVPPVQYIATCLCPNGQYAKADPTWIQDVEDAWLAKEGAQNAALDRLNICTGWFTAAIALVLLACAAGSTLLTGGTLTLPAIQACIIAVAGLGLFLELANCYRSYMESMSDADNAYDTALSIACNRLRNRGGCD